MIMNDEPWYSNPARMCVDENGNPIEEYSDLLLLPRSTNKKKVRIAELVDNCNRCPVLRECREDLLTGKKDWEHYGIQAGMVGKR